jgi:hypothetical protein
VLLAAYVGTLYHLANKGGASNAGEVRTGPFRPQPAE